MRLKDRDPSWEQTEELKELGKGEVKDRGRAILAKNIEGLAAARELLWANDTYGVLVVRQAMDAAGKDGTIKHVNGEEERPPAGTLDELLWREMPQLEPPKGEAPLTVIEPKLT